LKIALEKYECDEFNPDTSTKKGNSTHKDKFIRALENNLQPFLDIKSEKEILLGKDSVEHDEFDISSRHTTYGEPPAS
jgi:hypothetical protein